jgi:nitrate/nitrite-specific signal transduction histidine kinase
VSVSNTIKLLGALLIFTIFAVIAVTIYLNQKNVKDAMIINIAGKQRMLTQQITKNIYFINQSKKADFTQMDKALSQFNHGLETLKQGNENLGITQAPTSQIKNQIEKVQVLWDAFEKNTHEFKKAILENDIEKLNSLLTFFSNTNDELLMEVDLVVELYTQYIEEKTAFIKNFQYTAFAFLFIFALYALVQLKQIETHAREFMQKYKQLSSNDIENIELLEVDSEKEFVEMADHMNRFISKVSSAVNYSQSALEQSKLASSKLESLTDEFDTILSEIENNTDLSAQLDRSEDIVIQSNEELLRSAKKLQNLKTELDTILQNFKIDEHNQKGQK